jgi:hypothetical protein
MTKFRLRHEGSQAPATPADSKMRVNSVRALLDAAPRDALVELERGLRWHLYKPPEAPERRRRELGHLRELLLSDSAVIGGDLPYVERATYDASRPANAPSSERLQKGYGSWAMACVSASLLDEDGVYRNGVKNPPVDRRLVRYAVPYEREQCLEAIRECADDLGRVPSSHDYVLWRRLRCAALRARGITPRIPHWLVIYRFFPADGSTETRWRSAIDAAFA